MGRALPVLVLSLLLGAVPVCSGREKEEPKGGLGEKIDPGVDRTLTGTVTKVDAKDGKVGTLKMRISGATPDAPSSYTFQIDAKTKLLTPKGEPLPDGLKSRLLAGAEVRVEFVDEKPNGKPSPPKTHYARAVQLTKAKE